MKTIEMEMLSETINCPIVLIPGRRFPGMVIQGDSLSILLGLTNDIEHHCASLKNEELIATVARLRQHLTDYVSEYEATMKAHGLALPYVKGSP
jgi:hypothetical protein